MTPFLWLAGIVLMYVFATCAVVAGFLTWRVRSFGGAVTLVAAIVLAVLAHRCTAADPALALALSMGIGAVLSGVTVWKLRREGTRWQDVKRSREIGRHTVLHLVLLSGSLVFLVPFAWLVVTSLKEDEDMSQFPPVWIPKQQVMIHLDGKEVGLARASYKGQPVKVAVMQEKETGERTLRVLEPANLRDVQFESMRSDVHKIKKFGPVWKNYPDALKFLPPETHCGLVYLANTLWLCALGIIGTILSSSLVAFSFARLRWMGRDAMFVILLATMMLPGAVTMMPIFLIFRWLGWIDTLKPLWVPAFFSSAFNVFLLRQFFLTIPNDLEDAAKIDGCSYFTIYWRIMLPLIKPALAALTIMTFMGTWNNFMGPLIYISSPEKMPLAYALQLFQTAHGGEPGLLMAASTMMMVPVLAIFFFTQRYFIQGVTLTGIKG